MGFWNTHQIQQLGGLFQRFFLTDVLVGLDGLHQLGTNIKDWRKCRERILKDHADAIAADARHFLVRKSEEFATCKFNGAFYLGVFR